MVRCPVCDRENDSLQCANCGFDGSCDYERYPTLTPLKGRPDAISRRRESLRKQECDMLRCPNCGGSQFSVDFANQMYICSGCGHRFSPAVKAVEEQKTEPAKKSVSPKKREPEKKPAPATSLLERMRSTPRVEAVQTSEQEQPAVLVSKEEKPPRHWIEKSMILLGWLYIALHLYYFIFVSGKYPQLNCFLIGVALLMQLRLHREGFAAPFANKPVRILVRIVNFCAQVFFIPGLLFAVCVPFIMAGALLDGEIPSCAQCVAMLGFLYHFFWHFILTAGQDWNVIFPKK